MSAIGPTPPDQARVVDLAAYLRGLPGGELDPALRSDGVHFSVVGAQKITREWLGDEILQAYRELAARRKSVARAAPSPR